MIDIPDCLARQYIERGVLFPENIRRGDVFAWKLNVSSETSRCCFFSPEIYGCQIYVVALELRPPQCAIYPAGYTTGAVACKAGAGPWVVQDKEKGAACEKLLHVYRDFCLAERETCKHDLISSADYQLRGHFADLAREMPPSSIAGVKDTWHGLEPLEAEGISLTNKHACSGFCDRPYLECRSVCKPMLDDFIDMLCEVLPAFISARDMKEEYLLRDLVAFREEMKNE